MYAHRLPFSVKADHQTVFDLLLFVASKFDPPITLRIAGGWVRNSLLQIPSNDFDVAIQTQTSDASTVVTGETFARALAAHQKSIGAEARSIGVIQCNPKQSKHIAAACTHINGIAIDFLHLRSESYGDSRIPEVKRGTVEEDALRRDFTVNALYYNLHTQLIEDYVNGLEDLRMKLLRCPLDPHITFLDDPLRVLRAARFAAAFDFTLDKEILAASRRVDIQAALCSKVSRERISKEVGLSIERSTLSKTLAALNDLRCIESIFQYPEGKASVLKAFSWSTDEISSMNNIMSCLDMVGLNGVTDANSHRIACFYAAVFAFKKLHGECNDRIHACLCDGLKLSKSIATSAMRILDASLGFAQIIAIVMEGCSLPLPHMINQKCTDLFHPSTAPNFAACFDSASPSVRIRLFRIFRRLGGVDYLPPLCIAVVHASITKAINLGNVTPEAVIHIFHDVLREDPSNLVSCSTWKPLLRGDGIISHLGFKKQMIKVALDKVLLLQAECPSIRTSEAERLLKDNKKIFSED